MKHLIRKATIIDIDAEHDQQTLDVLIEDGLIRQISQQIDDKEAIEVNGKALCIFPGFVDVGVQTGEPGFEHREDLNSLAKAALAGGFTTLLTHPNTQPVAHSKSEVKYLIHQSANLAIDIHPIGAISIDTKGKDLTEMIDMFQAGAVAFSDGSHPIQDNGLMMRALQYVRAIDGIVLNRPHDEHIAAMGQLHEGATSTLLGMKGIPSLAEDLMVQRDIYLAEYTESKVHIHNISTKGAVALIREAKQKGLPITASTPVLNLFFKDQDLKGFDTNLKVLPPLRAEEDQQALIEGLKDGTIDFLSSNHVPVEEEGKKLEFPFAEFGATGLETAVSLSWTILKAHGFTLDDLSRLWGTNARNIFHLSHPTIKEGASANFTLVDMEQNWQVEKHDLRSRSKNSPLLGKTLTGRVIGVWNKHQSSFQ